MFSFSLFYAPFAMILFIQTEIMVNPQKVRERQNSGFFFVNTSLKPYQNRNIHIFLKTKDFQKNKATGFSHIP